MSGHRPSCRRWRLRQQLQHPPNERYWTFAQLAKGEGILTQAVHEDVLDPVPDFNPLAPHPHQTAPRPLSGDRRGWFAVRNTGACSSRGVKICLVVPPAVGYKGVVWEVPMASHKELRKHPRISLGLHAFASWEDRQGRRRPLTGTCTDISESGLGLRLRDQVSRNNKIRVQVPSLPLFGTGKVRYCERFAGEYRMWESNYRYRCPPRCSNRLGRPQNLQLHRNRELNIWVGPQGGLPIQGGGGCLRVRYCQTQYHRNPHRR